MDDMAAVIWKTGKVFRFRFFGLGIVLKMSIVQVLDKRKSVLSHDCYTRAMSR